jgi:hypothetical protein
MSFFRWLVTIVLLVILATLAGMFAAIIIDGFAAR